MKVITIFLDNGKTIYVNDDNEDDIEVYSNELSAILEESNIVILGTSESTLILRPSRIDGIDIVERKPIEESQVSALKDSIRDEIIESVSIKIDPEKIESTNVPEEEEDMITDGD